MVGPALLLCASALGGHATSARLWGRSDTDASTASPMDRALSTALLTLAIAVGISGALAFVHALTRLSLGIAFGLVAALASWDLARTRRPGPSAIAIDGRDAIAMVPALAAILVWVVFLAWRSSVVFVMSHDALAYHFPRALMIARDHGYRHVVSYDDRMTWPANYELLLADVLVVDGTDRWTGLVVIAAFLLFLLAVAAMAWRWWGPGLHVLVTVLVTASAPVVLLHAAAYKNDTLTWALILPAVYFGAQWCVRPRATPFVLGWVSVCLAIGTKLTGVMLAACLTPMLVLALVRHRTMAGSLGARKVAAWLAFATACVFLLGGEVFVVNLLATGRFFDPAKDAAVSIHWDHLWKFPYMLLTAPFSSAFPGGAWCPWTHSFWFYPTYDIHFSTFGAVTSLLVPVSLVGAWRYRRRAWGPSGAGDGSDLRFERVATSACLLALGALVTLMPQKPAFLVGCPRYIVGLGALVALWSVAPLCRELQGDSPLRQWAPRVSTIAAAALFIVSAVRSATNDTSQPLNFVVNVADGREAPRRIFTYPWRAASKLDELAGPDDTVAVDGSFDTWAYPAYGRELRRKVTFLTDETRTQPIDAHWVMIDRGWNCWFGAPEFVDLGVWSKYIGQGKPKPDDLALFRALRHDPHFRLRFRNPYVNQAVFERVEAN